MIPRTLNAAELLELLSRNENRAALVGDNLLLLGDDAETIDAMRRHAKRVDEAVTAERALYAAQHLAAEAQRARIAQSLQLAEAKHIATVAMRDGLAECDRLRAALMQFAPRCCTRFATWHSATGFSVACDECKAVLRDLGWREYPHADVLRSLDGVTR